MSIPALGYELTARVQQFTQVKLSAPRAVKALGELRVRAVVVGVKSSKFALTLTTRGRKPISALVPLTSAGRFTWTARPPTPGQWRLQATYYGDASHRGSRAIQMVNVV